MSTDERTPAQTLAAAIRALAAQYRDLAVADELNNVAIHAEQYPEMPATSRMQRALFDAEEVLMERLTAIQAGVAQIQADFASLEARDARQYAEGMDEIRRGQAEQDVVIAELRANLASALHVGDAIRQVQRDLETLSARDAHQYAESAQDRADARNRLDRIEAALAARQASDER